MIMNSLYNDKKQRRCNLINEKKKEWSNVLEKKSNDSFFQVVDRNRYHHIFKESPIKFILITVKKVVIPTHIHISR